MVTGVSVVERFPGPESVVVGLDSVLSKPPPVTEEYSEYG